MRYPNDAAALELGTLDWDKGTVSSGAERFVSTGHRNQAFLFWPICQELQRVFTSTFCTLLKHIPAPSAGVL